MILIENFTSFVLFIGLVQPLGFIFVIKESK